MAIDWRVLIGQSGHAATPPPAFEILIAAAVIVVGGMFTVWQ